MELRTRKVLFLFISFLLYCTKKTPSNLVKKHLFASYGDILISRVRVIEKKAYVSTWRLLEVKGSKIYLEKEEKIPGEEPISKKKVAYPIQKDSTVDTPLFRLKVYLVHEKGIYYEIFPKKPR